VLDELGEVEVAAAVALRGLGLALETGLEQWFRLGLRELAKANARRAMWEEAATLVAASRQGLPALLLDPAALGPNEQRCRAALGDARFEELAAGGEAMSHDELVAFVDADAGTAAAHVG